MPVLEEVTQAVRSVSERVGPAVVGLGRGWGRGSGVVIGDGVVLTTAHNLRGEEVTVTFGDGRRERGTVAALDAGDDLAVVALDTGDLHPLEWVHDKALCSGLEVFAIDNPGG